MKVFKSAVVALVLLSSASGLAQLPGRKDGVVVRGSQVRDFCGEKISQLGLMRWTGKDFQPIPFQVDEKTPEGNFIYLYGKKKNPELGNGKLDPQDELVFMAWDTGPAAPEGAKWPEDALKAAQVDAADRGKASVYLFSFKTAPPKSPVDYVQSVVEEGRDYVKTDKYIFGEPVGKGFFDRFQMVTPEGKMGPNFVDRIKGRGHISSMAGLIKLVKGEGDTPADMVAWIDGPVRVVHRMEGGVEIALGIKFKLAGGSDNVFYRHYLYTPIFFSLPAAAGVLLKGSYMLYTIDFNNNIKGDYYFDPVNPTPVIFDGKPGDQKKNLDTTSQHNWYAVGGDQANIAVRMVIPETLKQQVKLTTFFADDDNEADPPESETGRHQPGLKIAGWFEVPPGKYTYILYYMVSDQKLTADNISTWLDILDHPFKINSKNLNKN